MSANPHFHIITKDKETAGKRILIREITNPRLYAAITDQELYNDPSVLIIKDNPNNDFPVEVLLGILNSKLATFYHFRKPIFLEMIL